MRTEVLKIFENGILAGHQVNERHKQGAPVPSLLAFAAFWPGSFVVDGAADGRWLLLTPLTAAHQPTTPSSPPLAVDSGQDALR